MSKTNDAMQYSKFKLNREWKIGIASLKAGYNKGKNFNRWFDQRVAERMTVNADGDLSRATIQTSVDVLLLNQKKLNHIFISSSSLWSFLNSIEIKRSDADAVQSLADEFCKTNPGGVLVHAPRSVNEYSSMWFVGRPNDSQLRLVSLTRVNNEMLIDFDRWADDAKDKKSCQGSMFIKCLIYMDAFSDLAEKGAPKNAIVDALHEKSITLKAGEAVEGSRDVSSHLRRGHFRFLQAEVYTKKRFQTVYVKPTVVRGDATTLVMD